MGLRRRSEVLDDPRSNLLGRQPGTAEDEAGLEGKAAPAISPRLSVCSVETLTTPNTGIPTQNSALTTPSSVTPFDSLPNQTANFSRVA